MKITLRVNGELRALPINPRNPVLDIGRTPDNLLVLEGGSVSRRHLTIRYSSGVWSAIDTSSNGTWHNQAFFHHQRVILAEGDALVIGGHEVEVVSLPPLTDAGETSRVSAILLISANRGSGRVLLELSGKTLQVRISPQQEALFLLLLKQSGRRVRLHRARRRVCAARPAEPRHRTQQPTARLAEPTADLVAASPQEDPGAQPSPDRSVRHRAARSHPALAAGAAGQTRRPAPARRHIVRSSSCRERRGAAYSELWSRARQGEWTNSSRFERLTERSLCRSEEEIWYRSA